MGGELVGHAKADHAEVRDLLEELDGADPEDEGVFDLLTEALSTVLAHMDEEERIIFPMLRALLPAEQLARPGRPRPAPASTPPPPGEVVDLAGAERGDCGRGRAEGQDPPLLRR